MFGLTPKTVMRIWEAIGWTLLGASLIGWPISLLTFAKGEPFTVLGLSWLAITLNAAGILVTAMLFKLQTKQLEEGD